MARCTRCTNGKTTCTVITIEYPSRRSEETVTLDCIYCDGTGEDKGKVFLEDLVTWCGCEPAQQSFGSYPQYGECSCGVEKEHVHCGTCGNISQIG